MSQLKRRIQRKGKAFALRSTANRKKRAAKKQRSFSSLAKATLKGLPSAAKKVGRFAFSGITKASRQRKSRNQRDKEALDKVKSDRKKRGLKTRGF